MKYCWKFKYGLSLRSRGAITEGNVPVEIKKQLLLHLLLGCVCNGFVMIVMPGNIG